MRTVAILALWSAAALGQELAPNPEPMRVGSDMGFAPVETVLRYSLPEPVGWVELKFRSPNGTEFIAGGSLQFRDREVVELPRALLACMRAPRLGAVHLNTVYVIPEDGADGWFEEFWTRIVIPYDYSLDLENQTLIIREHPELHLEFLGSTLRRVVAARSPTEKDVLDAVPSGSQCESLR